MTEYDICKKRTKEREFISIKGVRTRFYDLDDARAAKKEIEKKMNIETVIYEEETWDGDILAWRVVE